MAHTDGDQPLSFVLLDGDPRKLSDLNDNQIKALRGLRSDLRLFGVDQNGNPRLPITHGIIEDTLALVMSKGASRAKLISETVKHEHFKRRRDHPEWEPDHRLYDRHDHPPKKGPKGMD